MNFLQCAGVCPRVVPADPETNAGEILRLLGELHRNGVQAAVFPELALTGATSGDLFFQDRLWQRVQEALAAIRAASLGSDLFFVVGSPIRVDHHLYNAAVVFQNGRTLGIVPKEHLSGPPLGQSRWFTQPSPTDGIRSLALLGERVPFGRLLFRSDQAVIAVELGDDLAAPLPPSTGAALSGADLILCPAASYEGAGRAERRRQIIRSQSGRCHLGYVQASAGVDESTTDLLFSGHLVIAENGRLLNENRRFQTESEIITAWLDLDRLKHEKRRNSSFRADRSPAPCEEVAFKLAPPDLERFDRPVDPMPFLPDGPEELEERCQEILAIQSHALARRMRAIGAKKCVLGISGGLDSTLALLVALKAQRINGREPSDIITVTMPGFGTMDRTYRNARTLCLELGTDLREISIEQAALQHFQDIGHDPALHDATYENTQSRERTQILMDLANKENSFVVGTGDLSELALGWATYNGDHMSMYGVNASVPKTLVRELIRHWAKTDASPKVAAILGDILQTPVSPELLPRSDSSDFVQKTEDLIGPYELHDFFLWHFLRHGADPDKILFLAGHAFRDQYSREEIRGWLKVFIRRFFTNQFKRSALPDGPKVGSLSLSPRGDHAMPSDVTWRSWALE